MSPHRERSSFWLVAVGVVMGLICQVSLALNGNL